MILHNLARCLSDAPADDQQVAALQAVLEAAWCSAVECIDETHRLAEAQRVAGEVLASLMADASGESYSDIWAALCSVPDELLHLLSSPEGWAALSAYTSSAFGLTPSFIMPTVH